MDLLDSCSQPLLTGKQENDRGGSTVRTCARTAKKKKEEGKKAKPRGITVALITASYKTHVSTLLPTSSSPATRGMRAHLGDNKLNIVEIHISEPLLLLLLRLFLPPSSRAPPPPCRQAPPLPLPPLSLPSSLYLHGSKRGHAGAYGSSFSLLPFEAELSWGYLHLSHLAAFVQFQRRAHIICPAAPSSVALDFAFYVCLFFLTKG